MSFDLPTLVELFDGDRAAIGTLLESALAAIREDGMLIETGVADDDRALIVEMAHRLKGTSGSIGARRLTAIGSRIERAALKSTTAVRALLPLLRAAVTLLSGHIDAYRSSP